MSASVELIDPVLAMADRALSAFGDPVWWGSIPRFVVPVLLAAQGGALCQRAGVFNIALEGKMLAGAFAAVAVSYATGSALLGALAALLAGMLFGAIFAVASAWKRGDAIVVSIAINLLASGMTAFGLRAFFGRKGSFDDPGIVALDSFDIPLLGELPVIGAFFAGQTAVVWLALVLTVAAHGFLVHHRWGLWLRGVGENPAAARSAGVSVAWVRTGALLACGAFCGLAGAQLSIGAVSLFVEDMSAGRGWIAVVVVIMARARPWTVALVALLFGAVDSLSVRIQGAGLPQQVTEALPYVVTLLVLVLASRRRARS